ncbi:hypothetical protein MHYP_G00203300 [Metynnis hypsauchen]
MGNFSAPTHHVFTKLNIVYRGNAKINRTWSWSCSSRPHACPRPSGHPPKRTPSTSPSAPTLAPPLDRLLEKTLLLLENLLDSLVCGAHFIRRSHARTSLRDSNPWRKGVLEHSVQKQPYNLVPGLHVRCVHLKQS